MAERRPSGSRAIRRPAASSIRCAQEVSRARRHARHGRHGKLGEYLDSVREIEQRIQNAETQRRAGRSSCRSGPIDVPAAFDEHTKLMFDLQVLGFQADMTRVFSMIMSRELSSPTFRRSACPSSITRCRTTATIPSSSRRRRKIDAYQVQLLAYFLGEAAGDARRRRHAAGSQPDAVRRRHGRRQPASPHRPAVRAAGKLGGRFETGRHLAYPQDTPMTNLLLRSSRQPASAVDKLGDSTGKLEPDLLSLG